MKHPNLLNCVIAIWGLVPPNARDQSLSSSLKLPRPLKVTVQGQGLSFSTNKTARHHPAPSGHHRDSFKGILREGRGLRLGPRQQTPAPPWGHPACKASSTPVIAERGEPSPGHQPAKYIFTTSDILGILPTEPLFSLGF